MDGNENSINKERRYACISKKYPFKTQENGVIGFVHRASFLPKAFSLPAGKLLVEVVDGGQVMTVTRYYPRQVIIVKIPDLEVFVPDSPVYEGPIDLVAPDMYIGVIKCGTEINSQTKFTPKLSKRLKQTQVYLFPTPVNTTIKFWPPLYPGQTLQNDEHVFARTRHACRTEVNGFRDHLLRNLNVILDRQQINQCFYRKSKELRKEVLIREANKAILRRTTYMTRSTSSLKNVQEKMETESCSSPECPEEVKKQSFNINQASSPNRPQQFKDRRQSRKMMQIVENDGEEMLKTNDLSEKSTQEITGHTTRVISKRTVKVTKTAGKPDNTMKSPPREVRILIPKTPDTKKTSEKQVNQEEEKSSVPSSFLESEEPRSSLCDKITERIVNLKFW
jgi:hypothetical protein